MNKQKLPALYEVASLCLPSRQCCSNIGNKSKHTRTNKKEKSSRHHVKRTMMIGCTYNRPWTGRTHGYLAGLHSLSTVYTILQTINMNSSAFAIFPELLTAFTASYTASSQPCPRETAGARASGASSPELVAFHEWKRREEKRKRKGGACRTRTPGCSVSC